MYGVGACLRNLHGNTVFADQYIAAGGKLKIAELELKPSK